MTATSPRRPILSLTTHRPAPPSQSLSPDAVRVLVLQRWPDMFNKAAPRPLQKGIAAPLAQGLGISRREASAFLFTWVTTDSYHKAVAAPGSTRHALDGAAVEPVTETEREFAIAALSRRIEAHNGSR